MSSYHKIISNLEETKNFYSAEIEKKKTIASKKAYMTRMIKDHESFLNSIIEAIANGKKRGDHFGWYHGEIFQTTHIRFYTREVEMLKAMRAAIS